ncbi:MAG: hypothetical protein Q8N98_03985 [bacterium]|nr:hypothetical protein [bacterium]
MDTAIRKAILSTLAYHDIFDYPLTPKELSAFLITDICVREQTIAQCLAEMVKKNEIGNKDEFYFLKGRNELAEIRKNRQAASLKKWEIAKRTANFLKFIPTLKLIGVSGSLSMDNAGAEEDIDFFFITKSGWLWTSRFLVTGFLWLMGVKRKPDLSKSLLHRPGVFFRDRRQLLQANVTNATFVKDKICPNIFLDENYLAFPKEDRNLYTAHEIVQAKPFWWKDKTYERFLAENAWIKQFMANAWNDLNSKHQIPNSKQITGQQTGSKSKIFGFTTVVIEEIMKRLQLKYMAAKRTNERIEKGRLFFHPQDQGKPVLRKHLSYLKSLRER